MISLPLSFERSSLRGKALAKAYRAQHEAIRLSLVVAHRALAALGAKRHAPDPAVVAAVQRRYDELLKRDVENVRAGYYPASLCFSLPLRRYARQLPGLALDVPRMLLRRRRNAFRDLPEDVDLSSFPPYYRRTFHWQTDGYLSAHSATLYDVGVEFLFVGCADVMRRQVVPAVARLRATLGRPLRVLDVGCGTGRTLLQLTRAMPDNMYSGVDLSPFYVAEARRLLGDEERIELVQAAAEQLPFGEGEFDAVVSVFLFHELPRAVRRRALGEMHRVLRPGGLVVIEDSVQAADAPDIGVVLENFSKDMHEPFYADYLGDALEPLLRECGFTVLGTEPCFVAKVVEAVRSERVSS